MDRRRHLQEFLDRPIPTAQDCDGFEERENLVDYMLEMVDLMSGNQAQRILRAILTDHAQFGEDSLNYFRDLFLRAVDTAANGLLVLPQYSDFEEASRTWERQWMEDQDGFAQDEEAHVLVSSSGGAGALVLNNRQAGVRNVAVSGLPPVTMHRGHLTINQCFMHPNSRRSARIETVEPEWFVCGLCNYRYREEDNVLQDNDRPPCGYHTGRIVDYQNSYTPRVSQNNAVCRVGEAWNCCRREPNSRGCHPAFHQPAR